MLRKAASTASVQLDTYIFRNSFGVAGPSRCESTSTQLASESQRQQDGDDSFASIPRKTRNLLNLSRSDFDKRFREHHNANHTKEMSKNEASIFMRPDKRLGGVEPRRLLRPSVLSERVKKLCDAKKLQVAVSMVQNSPLDAQNTIVWNTLMTEALKVRRYRLAYELYTDMKRRGMKPSTGTFVTMFSGLSKIENWEKHPKQLAHCHSLYDHFLRHIDAVSASSPKQVHVSPIAQYIRILATANLHQKVFDVFNAMDETGPMAPNEFVFAAMFAALNRRNSTDKTDGLSIAAQNASDAKLLWRQMVKASEKGRFPIDERIIDLAVRVLAKGRPADQTFAFDIIRDYLGLARPGEAPQSAKVPMKVWTLQTVLQLCNAMQKYRLCIHYAQQVMNKPLGRGESTIIERRHMEQVLIAYARPAALGSLSESTHALETIKWMLRNEGLGKSPEQLSPKRSTYNLALMACWRGGDWHTAAEVFEIMTSRCASDFSDSAAGAATPDGEHTSGPPKFRSFQPLTPNAHTMSCLVRTAWASRDRANMRQCLRIVDYYGVKSFFASAAADLVVEERYGKVAKKSHVMYYQVKLAADLVKMVDYVLLGRASHNDDSARRWQALKDDAKQAQDDLRHTADKITIPLLERELGSRSGLEMMQEAIDFQMATRA